MNGYSFITSTTWPEVFAAWKQRETGFWDEHIKERGFLSWEAWREQWTVPLKLAERKWELYKVGDPFSTVPSLLVGAYKGWHKYYPEGARVATFADIAKNPELAENPKVKAILANFPIPTEIIILKRGDQHVLFEGTHRCAAIALAAREGERFPLYLTVAMTEFGEDEGELFTKTYTQRAE